MPESRISSTHCEAEDEAAEAVDDCGGGDEATAVPAVKTQHSADYRRAGRVLVNLKADLLANFDYKLTPSVKHVLRLLTGEASEWYVPVKSFRRRVWVVMLEPHPDREDALSIKIPFVILPLLFVIDSSLRSAAELQLQHAIDLVEVELDFREDVNAFFISSITALTASSKSLSTSGRVGGGRRRGDGDNRHAEHADDIAIDAELGAYAEDAPEGADDDNGDDEDNPDMQMGRDETVDDQELRQAVEMIAKAKPGKIDKLLDNPGEGDPAATDLDVEVDAVLQEVANPRGAAAVNDAFENDDAPAAYADPGMLPGMLRRWAQLCDDMVTAAVGCSALPREPKLRHLSFVVDSVDAHTRTCKWIFWDDPEKFEGRHVRVDRGRVIFRPKGRKLPNGLFENVQCFIHNVQQGGMTLVIPDADCGMHRTSDRMLMTEVPKNSLAVARFHSLSHGPTDIDADVAGVHCEYCNVRGIEEAVFECAWCGMQQHDSCAHEVELWRVDV